MARQQRSGDEYDRHKASAYERCYDIMRDALLVINANGDQISSSTAHRTLKKVNSELRRMNI